MKSLVILKGLVKEDKLGWVKEQGLENFFLDVDVIRRLYSTPELIGPNEGILGRSYSTLVHRKFMEILCTRLGKGCMIVVDFENESTSTLETLATVFGYEIFYVVKPIPQDYYGRPKKYSLPWYVTKTREELETEVKNFLEQHFDSKNKINTYQDIINWWKNRDKIINLSPTDIVLHVSDIHSNFDIYKDIKLKQDKYQFMIFHGDYIDGPEIGGSRRMIDEIINLPSSPTRIWLEGNHELRLRRYLGWMYFKNSGKKQVAEYLLSELSEEFLQTTAKEFNDLNPQQALEYLKDMNKKLKTHVLLKRDNSTYICTHAGIKYPEQIQPKYIGNVIYGNRDMDRYDKEFSGRNKKTGLYSIHAHCKYPQGWNVSKYPGVLNIDPEDETKVVILENNNWNACQLERLNSQ